MTRLQPCLVRDSVRFELPSPILACRIQDSWDFLKMKVPRLDGEIFSGGSLNGVVIQLEGQIGSSSGLLKLTEEEMLQTAIELRQSLVVNDDSGFTLELFSEAGIGCYQFEKCMATRCEIDFSNPHLFSYSLAIFASNPALLFYGA